MLSCSPRLFKHGRLKHSDGHGAAIQGAMKHFLWRSSLTPHSLLSSLKPCYSLSVSFVELESSFMTLISVYIHKVNYSYFILYFQANNHFHCLH